MFDSECHGKTFSYSQVPEEPKPSAIRTSDLIPKEAQSSKLDLLVPRKTPSSEEFLEEDEEIRCTSAITRQKLVSIFASVTALSIAFTSSYPSVVLPQLRNDTLIGYREHDANFLGSIIPWVTSIVGSLVGALVMEIQGPRKTLLLGSLPTVLAWFLIAFSASSIYVYMGLGVMGFFVGVFHVVPQIYICEMASPKLRGMLGAIPELTLQLGYLIFYGFGTKMHWRYLAVTCGILPGFPLLSTMMFLPESPQWLSKKNKLTKTRKALRYFRKNGKSVKEEMQLLQKHSVEAETNDVTILQQFKLFKRPCNWKPILLVFLLFMCRPLSGSSLASHYSHEIFTIAGVNISKLDCAAVIGAVRFLSTLLSALLLDRIGRKAMLSISAIGSAVGMVVMGVIFYYKTSLEVEGLNLIPLAFLLAYVFFNQLGFGPLPWLLSGELLPLAVRTLGTGVIVTAYSILSYIIEILIQQVSLDYSITLLPGYSFFWIYSCFGLLGIVIGIFIPETKGKTLEEIEDLQYCACRKRVLVLNT